MAELFEEIRSYRDEEVNDTITKLMKQYNVSHALGVFFPGQDINELLSSIHSVYDFQHKLMYPIFVNHIKPTFSEMTCSGVEHLDPKKPYLFISNHRDIVLDSALLNYYLHEAGIPTAEIAIGDNLLDRDWIKELVRLNKSFIVKRGLNNIEMLKSSRHLSKYIHHTILEKKHSVWIAQRSGRAKDGNDETYRGLINMLYMSSNNGIIEHFKSLNIVPVTISYEFDPCDGRKTNELYRDSLHGDYVKAANEDVESIKMGIVLPKGKGHLHFGKVINERIGALSSLDRKGEMITHICSEIDRQIQENYKLWPSNYAAHELRKNLDTTNGFSKEERDQFSKRMNEALAKLDGDKSKLRDIFLSMYEFPLLNKQKWANISSPVT